MNNDAVVLVGFFSILGPAFAVTAAVVAARGPLRSTGLLLVVSAVATPTYFAYPLNVVVLAAGAWLTSTAGKAATGRRRTELA